MSEDNYVPDPKAKFNPDVAAKRLEERQRLEAQSEIYQKYVGYVSPSVFKFSVILAILLGIMLGAALMRFLP